MLKLNEISHLLILCECLSGKNIYKPSWGLPRLILFKTGTMIELKILCIYFVAILLSKALASTTSRNLGGDGESD
jgi:hypothetical protein